MENITSWFNFNDYTYISIGYITLLMSLIAFDKYGIYLRMWFYKPEHVEISDDLDLDETLKEEYNDL